MGTDRKSLVQEARMELIEPVAWLGRVGERGKEEEGVKTTKLRCLGDRGHSGGFSGNEDAVLSGGNGGGGCEASWPFTPHSSTS